MSVLNFWRFLFKVVRVQTELSCCSLAVNMKTFWKYSFPTSESRPPRSAWSQMIYIPICPRHPWQILSRVTLVGHFWTDVVFPTFVISHRPFRAACGSSEAAACWRLELERCPRQTPPATPCWRPSISTTKNALIKRLLSLNQSLVSAHCMLTYFNEMPLKYKYPWWS